jgi:hypothetical protein
VKGRLYGVGVLSATFTKEQSRLMQEFFFSPPPPHISFSFLHLEEYNRIQTGH